MKKNNQPEDTKQSGGITDKKDTNAGSGAFNHGSAQDPDYMNGVTGDQNDPEKLRKKKENPKSGNIGKNNAGGYK